MNELEVIDSQILKADIHPANVYLGSLASGSRRTMTAALENIAQIFGVDALHLNWAAIRYQHVQLIRSRLMEVYAPATANRHMAALRGVLKESWRLGHITSDDYMRSVDVKPVKGERALAGRYIERDEVEKIIEVCLKRPTINGVRDAAIVGMLYVCGLRRDELVSLDVTDYHHNDVHVIGKGNKERTVPVNEALQGLLARWLTLRGELSGALFLNTSTGRPLTTQAVYTMLKRRGKAAGIAKLSPHDFRHTFISRLLDAGVDIATTAKLAGHSDVEITRRYDRRDDRTARAAVELLDIPGVNW